MERKRLQSDYDHLPPNKRAAADGPDDTEVEEEYVRWDSNRSLVFRSNVGRVWAGVQFCESWNML